MTPVNRSMMLWWAVLIVHASVAYGGQERVVEACSYNSMALSCPSGHSISIQQVELGESSCYRWQTCCPRTGDCTRPASGPHQASVRAECNGQMSCQVTATKEYIECAGNSEFERIKYICNDVNECETNNRPQKCNLHATCSNTPGSYTCQCNSGFTGDGMSCNDIDECTAESHKCSPQATCSNTQSSFTCTCDNGYVGDGFVCNTETTMMESMSRLPSMPGATTTNAAAAGTSVLDSASSGEIPMNEDSNDLPAWDQSSFPPHFKEDNNETFDLSNAIAASKSDNRQVDLSSTTLYVLIGVGVLGLLMLVASIMALVRYRAQQRNKSQIATECVMAYGESDSPYVNSADAEAAEYNVSACEQVLLTNSQRSNRI